MIKVGLVDQYLNNWHTDHYPKYLHLATQLYGFEIQVVEAYALMDHPGDGMTTDEWCVWQKINRASSYEELLDHVDVIMVMCADDCTHHEKLAQKALESGKPVFCDKTFAPTLEAAARMFDYAEQNSTPLFTCSAQRFCMELLCYQQTNKHPVNFCATTGPGDIINYSIHQFEMIQTLMGCGAVRCMAHSTGETCHVLYEYPQGRQATFTQSPKTPFTIIVSDEHDNKENITVSDYYMNFFHALCQFFVDRKPPVSREATLEIMAMQQSAREALRQNDKWINISITG